MFSKVDGGFVLSAIALVCVAVLVGIGRDATAFVGFVTLLPTLGLYVKLNRVEKQTNGQLDAARTGAHQAGYVAGYIDAINGRAPEHDETPSGIRVADAFPSDADIEAARVAAAAKRAQPAQRTIPPQRGPAAGGRAPRRAGGG